MKNDPLINFVRLRGVKPTLLSNTLLLLELHQSTSLSTCRLVQTDLLSGVFYTTKTPICFRFLPHQFNNGGLTSREALFLSSSTWPVGVKPVFIHSEPEASDEFGVPSSPSPSDYLHYRIPTFNLETDIIVDCGERDLACVKYMLENKSLKPIIINKVPE